MVDDGCEILGLSIARTVIQLGRISFCFFQPSHRDMRESKNNSREMAVPVFGRGEGRVRVSFTTPAVY